MIEAVAGYFDRLRQASRSRRSLLCVGLDPDPERIPGGAAGALRRCVEVAEVRSASPLPFLVPGVGSQGGDLERSVRAAWNGDEASCLISASRWVLYADDPGKEASRLRDAINAVIGAAAG